MQCTLTIILACLIFSIIALCLFSYLNFVKNISPKPYYVYEILWVDRSHQGGVQCTWTVTLVYLFFELLPFVYFHTWILCVAYLQNYTCYGYEILWVDRSHQGGEQCTRTLTLARLSFEFLPFLIHTWFLSGAYLKNYTTYDNEILLVNRSHQGGSAVHMNLNSCLLNFWVIALCLFLYLNFVRCISPRLY